MQTLVYVINKNGSPLMPCKPAKARHLLRADKAKVAKRCPFTIQLLWDCEENAQPTTLGIDKGSKFTGLSVVQDDNSKVLFQAELRHRLDVKEKMTARREHRRLRRNRKWYRPPRFLNRASSKRSGRLPPSIKTNVEEVLRVVNKIPLPISKIIVEDVLVDIRKLTTPEVKGKGYQVSNRLDENLRLSCLMRDKFKCQNPKCKGHIRSLHAHHITWRSKGGKDTITNLIMLCNKCHGDLHQGKWVLKIKGASNFKDQIAQRTMQGKSYLYQELRVLCSNLEIVYGYQTSIKRHELGLNKTHLMDAYVIAGGDITPTIYNAYRINFRLRQTRRQYHTLPQRGKGRVKYQVNEELEGFRKGDVVKVLYKEKCFIKQINSISSQSKRGDAPRLAFGRVGGEPSSVLPRDCRLLEKQQTVITIPYI